MDFSIVRRQIIMEYLKLYGSDCESSEWSLRVCLHLFKFYYEKYKNAFGEDHPRLSNRTINRILASFPSVSDEIGKCSGDIDFSPEDYPALIERYFSSKMNCDFSIAHFMSGNIRTVLYYETLY